MAQFKTPKNRNQSNFKQYLEPSSVISITLEKMYKILKRDLIIRSLVSFRWTLI